MRVGLIGGAVIAHSRSPRMHNAAFAALGMDIVYELWPTEPEGLVEKVNLLRQEEVVGSNVTVPHKEAVLQLVDQVSETARRIGSVNTLIPRGDILIGDNTDAYGYGASIRESYPELRRSARLYWVPVELLDPSSWHSRIWAPAKSLSSTAHMRGRKHWPPS
ncbi:MAG: hypothetical protein M9909_09525 [Thermomicrobiales bacterium]|nr:hypothetical protein [Thermomicrobiales bacterium]